MAVGAACASQSSITLVLAHTTSKLVTVYGLFQMFLKKVTHGPYIVTQFLKADTHQSLDTQKFSETASGGI